MSEKNLQLELAQQAKNLKDNMPAFLEYARLNAVIQREKYLALRANGFDERQALELCKQVY